MSYPILNLPIPVMHIKTLTIAIIGILALSSCRSIRNLGAKSNSSASAAPARPRSTAQRSFLDGIEVTPGSVVTSNHKTNTSVKTAEPAAKTNNRKRKPEEDAGITGNIENAHLLQIKYAIALDATVEKLTNIPLLELIDKWWGTKYCMGGSTDNCIDCSAFTQLILKEIYQQSLPRTSQEQFNIAEKIDLEELREGDLVFFNTGGRDISHVGVYLLNNKFVHAATSGGVMISDLNEKYWQPKFRGAGRINNN